MKKIKKIFAVLFLLNGLVFAQNNGKIVGKVIDVTTNQPLIGVNVLISGTTLGSSTDEKGEFAISGLAPGNYQIESSIIGYAKKVIPDVIVNTVKPTYLLIKLRESIIELEGVEVTADLFSSVPTEVNSIKSLSYEEIRRSPGGFEDVIRALSVLPGVARQNAGRNDLIVRGGAPSENLYLVDGFVVPNINHFGTQGSTGGPLSFINLDFVQETTFSTGGFQANYGDKLSSVLKIDLRDARKDKLGGKLLLSASQFGLNLEGPISNKSDFLFSLRRSYLDFIFDAAGFNFVPEYYDLLTKINYNFSNNDKLSFLFVGALDNVKFNNNDEEDIFENARILGNDQTQYTSGISYKHLFNNGYYTLSLSRNYIEYDAFQNDTLLNPIFVNKTSEAEHEIKADIIVKTTQSSELNFGFSFKNILYEGNILFPEKFVTSFGETLPLNSANVDESFTKTSAYGVFSSIIFNKVRYNVGLRINYFNAIDKQINYSPRISLAYVHDELTTISFSSGIYHQSPSYIWLTYKDNKALNPIRVNQYILGLSRLLSTDLSIKVEAFYKSYHDYPTSELRPYLILANSGAGFGGAEDNYSSFGLEPLVSKGKGISKGIEFSVQKKSSGSNLYGIASVTYSETDFTALDGIERNGMFEQNWILNISGGYIFNDKWEASLRFRYASGSPYTPFNKDGTQSVKNYLTKNLNNSHALDVRVDRRWNFSSWSLITYIDIQNIYNNKNVTQLRWDYAENKVEENKEIGILPSIGVSLEF